MKVAGEPTGLLVNPSCNCPLACAALSNEQDGNGAVGQLANDTFHSPHIGAGRVREHPFRPKVFLVFCTGKTLFHHSAHEYVDRELQDLTSAEQHGLCQSDPATGRVSLREPQVMFSET